MKWRRIMRKKETISKILKLKDNKKKEIEIKVREAYGRVEEENSRLHALQSDYNNRLNYFKEAHKEGVFSARDVISHYEMLSHIDGKIEEQKRINIECESVLQSLEKTLVEAHKDKKSIEILDDKITRQEQKENALAEQKELDYLGVTRKIK
jgi:flagellar export protein FliJ